MDEKRLRNIWACMLTRCLNPNAKTFAAYGGRGIGVCSQWKQDYEAFAAWAINNGYDDGLILGRRDKDGHYSPDNCRWVTRKFCGNNRRDNVRYKINGEIGTATELAEASGVPVQTFYRRLQRGWDVERAMTQPVRTYGGG